MYSRVLRSFKVLDDDYRIKFIEPENVDASVEIMKNFFIPYESMVRALEVKKDPKKVEGVLKFWRNLIKEEKVSIGCFKVESDGSEKLIGVNVLTVKQKENEQDGSENPSEFDPTRGALGFMEKSFDVFEHYNVEKFLYAFGLAVDCDFWGRGIATEMLKARVEILKFLNLKVTSTIFTSAASQKAALKAGFEENLMKTYEEIHKIDERIFFPGLENECMKVMSMKI